MLRVYLWPFVYKFIVFFRICIWDKFPLVATNIVATYRSNIDSFMLVRKHLASSVSPLYIYRRIGLLTVNCHVLKPRSSYPSQSLSGHQFWSTRGACLHNLNPLSNPRNSHILNNLTWCRHLRKESRKCGLQYYYINSAQNLYFL